jgi:hypothetical protein
VGIPAPPHAAGNGRKSNGRPGFVKTGGSGVRWVAGGAPEPRPHIRRRGLRRLECRIKLSLGGSTGPPSVRAPPLMNAGRSVRAPPLMNAGRSVRAPLLMNAGRAKGARWWSAAATGWLVLLAGRAKGARWWSAAATGWLVLLAGRTKGARWWSAAASRWLVLLALIATVREGTRTQPWRWPNAALEMTEGSLRDERGQPRAFPEPTLRSREPSL